MTKPSNAAPGGLAKQSEATTKRQLAKPQSAPRSGLIDQAPPPGRVSSDFALGAVGCGLAVVSASFGLYMNVHGPVAHQPGNDFSVFAQLAPRTSPAQRPDESEPLDLTPTASIAAPGASRQPTMASMVLQSATADAATISVAGRSLSVRVGDTIPGGGEVLAIYPGARPLVRTSRGTILATRAP